MIRPSSGMPSCFKMSARVRLSAVAVSASRGTSRIVVEQRLQLPIVGPEIVAPFADAMRLVDRDQRQVHAAHQPPERIARRPFRRDIKQVELAALEPLHGRLAVGVRRGQRGRAQPDRIRRCGSGRASARSAARSTSAVPSRASAGKLVAERLARPRRHDRQRVLAQPGRGRRPLPARRGNDRSRRRV